MELISNPDVQKLNDGELSALFTKISKGLIRTKPHSAERRDALASLETIGRERVLRLKGPAP